LAQLANFGYNVNASFPDDPVAVVSRLVPVKLEKSGEELFVDQFGDDWYLQYGLFSDLIVDVLAKRKQLQSDELFAKARSEALAHAAEHLHCHNPVIFVVVVMGHFDDMLQYKISPILIVQVVGYFCDLLSSQFFDLGNFESTSSCG
jgi:hypothetical protein